MLMITSSLKQIEEIDRPNCLLFQSKIKSYLCEKDTTYIGKYFEELLKYYPSFIDGYIEYWKYLKFKLTQF